MLKISQHCGIHVKIEKNSFAIFCITKLTCYSWYTAGVSLYSISTVLQMKLDLSIPLKYTILFGNINKKGAPMFKPFPIWILVNRYVSTSSLPMQQACKNFVTYKQKIYKLVVSLFSSCLNP